jgi:hypothetical protein
MLYEGLEEDGLKCIRNIRDRYDGMKRSPFDEAECGHHYGRAMASWSAILAMTGFHYSAVDRSMSFKPIEGKYFWSNGYQYGTVEIKDQGKHKIVSLNILSGELTLNSFVLNGFGQADFTYGKTIKTGQSVEFEVESNLSIN